MPPIALRVALAALLCSPALVGGQQLPSSEAELPASGLDPSVLDEHCPEAPDYWCALGEEGSLIHVTRPRPRDRWIYVTPETGEFDLNTTWGGDLTVKIGGEDRLSDWELIFKAPDGRLPPGPLGQLTRDGDRATGSFWMMGPSNDCDGAYSHLEVTALGVNLHGDVERLALEVEYVCENLAVLHGRLCVGCRAREGALVFSQSVESAARLGEPFVHRVVVENPGPHEAHQVQVFDVVPEGLRVMGARVEGGRASGHCHLSAPPPTEFAFKRSPGPDRPSIFKGWPGERHGSGVRCYFGTLAAGESVAVEVNKVAAEIGSIHSSVILMAQEDDLVPNTNVLNSEVRVEARPGGGPPGRGPALGGLVEISGSLEVAAEGDQVIWTVRLTNRGRAPQADNPGHEFELELPDLTISSIFNGLQSSHGKMETIFEEGPFRAIWNGGLEPGQSVEIRISTDYSFRSEEPYRSLQGKIFFDADANGLNESVGLTDDPGQPGSSDPTIWDPAS